MKNNNNTVEFTQINVSAFKNTYDTSNPYDISILEALTRIREGKSKSKVERIRKLQQDFEKEEDGTPQYEKLKDQKSKAKEKLPSIVFQGTFSIRQNKGLKKSSGLACVDFDHQPDPIATKETIFSDAHCVAAWISPSGNGVKALFRIPEVEGDDQYKIHYKALLDYLNTKADKGTTDICRICYESYDPEILIRNLSEAKIFKGVAVDPSPKETITSAPNPTKDHCAPNPTKDHWALKIACEKIRTAPDGLKHNTRRKQSRIIGGYIASGEIKEDDALAKLVSAASQNSTLKPHQYEKDITYGIENGKLKPLQSLPNFNKTYIAEVAADRKSKVGENGGYPDEESAVNAALEHLKKIDGLKGEEVEQIVRKAKAKKPQGNFTVKTLIDYIKKYNFIKNEITDQITSNGRKYDTAFQNSIYLDAAIKFGKKNVTREIIDAIIVSDNTPVYNPLHDFYEKHKNLPHKPEIINEFITCIQSDTEHAGPWVRKWLIAMAESALYNQDQNYYSRIMLVLCGGQYIGKSHFFRHILPPKLLNFYAESVLDRGKDDELLMTQKLIINVDEYAGKTIQHDPEKLKRLISQKDFSLRRPYGRNNEDIKRLAILAGTSNNSDVLNDATGNTRIIPINVISIDWDIYNQYDKTHLFIELIRAVKNGENSRLTPDQIKSLQNISKDHTTVNYESELIMKYFEACPYEEKETGEFFTATDVINTINLHSMAKIPDSRIRQIGRELSSLFKEQKTNALRSGKRLKGYFLRQKNIAIPHYN